jgi:hypothetical protein
MTTGTLYTYMAVPPLPGSLWLFSGGIPHAVLPTVLPHGTEEPKLARISVGINFSDARSAAPAPAAVPLDHVCTPSPVGVSVRCCTRTSS